MLGGVNMCKAQIYIRKRAFFSTKKMGRGVVCQLGRLYPPRGGVQISLVGLSLVGSVIRLRCRGSFIRLRRAG